MHPKVSKFTPPLAAPPNHTSYLYLIFYPSFISRYSAMEPGPYQNFVSRIGILPPRIPDPEAPGDDEMSKGAPAPLNLNANWTVYSSNILRGDLSGKSQGPLIATDWARDSQEKGKEKELTPWMSSTEQQPFMWDVPQDET